MLLIGVLIACIGSFFLGYHFRGLTKKIGQLEETVKSKVDKQPIPEEPKSTVLDPDDPIQQAQWEREELMKKLNPGEQ